VSRHGAAAVFVFVGVFVFAGVFVFVGVSLIW
jgi:hypothetical protein